MTEQTKKPPASISELMERVAMERGKRTIDNVQAARRFLKEVSALRTA